MFPLLLMVLLNLFPLREDQPVFKGDAKGLDNFLTKNLIYPEFSKQNCLQGTVQVSFRLTKNGRIYSSAVTKGFGTDLDKEALRIVRLTTGKWEIPGGYDTTAYVMLPVTFALKEEPKCANISKDQINAAIAAYRTYDGLSKAVLNFYDNKALGKYDASREEQILQVKEQLGYDDKFINRMLKQAAGKLKQGDKEGGCEDLNFIRRIGSGKADKQLAASCAIQQIK